MVRISRAIDSSDNVLNVSRALVMVLLLMSMSLLPVECVFGDNGNVDERQEDYDLLVIQGHFQVGDLLQDLVDHKSTFGIRTRVVKIDDVLSTSPGRDDAEKVKRYIYEQYTQDHIRYVLLVGAGHGVDPVFPVRHVSAPWESGAELSIPCDLYFADVSYDNGAFSSWDTDADDLFGVYDEDNIDYVPEVAVGRLPARTRDEVAIAVSHIIAYGDMSARPFPGGEDDWFRKAVLVGSDSHPVSQIPSTHNPDIASGEWQIDYLERERLPGYDVVKFKEWDGTISTEGIMEELEEGAGLFYISDHGFHQAKGDRKVNGAVWNVSWDEEWPVITEDRVAELQNGEAMFFVTANICDGATFDEEGRDGFLTAYLFNPDGGAIGYYSSSRTAWDGNGKYIMRTYSGRVLDNLFASLQDGAPTYGDAVRSAQAKFARENMEVGAGQWLNLVEFNYFGDPSVAPGGAGARASVSSPQDPSEDNVELTITNTLQNAVPVVLELKGMPEEWSPVLSTTEVTVEPYKKERVTLAFEVPDDAWVGDCTEAHLEVREANSGDILDVLHIPVKATNWQEVLSFDISTIESEWTYTETDTYWTLHNSGAPLGYLLRYQSWWTGDYFHMMDDPISTILGLQDAKGNVSLSFETNHFIEEKYDHVYVECSPDGAVWTMVHDISNESAGWTNVTINISWLAGSMGHLRFRFTSDEYTNEWGVLINNVTVSNETVTYFSDDFEAGLDQWTSKRHYYESPYINIDSADRVVLRLDTDFNRTRTDTGTFFRVRTYDNISWWGLDTLMGDLDGPETRYYDLDEYVGNTIKLRVGPFYERYIDESGISMFTGSMWTETRATDVSVEADLPLVVTSGQVVNGDVHLRNNGLGPVDEVPLIIEARSEATGLSYEILNTTEFLDLFEETTVPYDWTVPSGPEAAGWYQVTVSSPLADDEFPDDNQVTSEMFIGDVLFKDDFETENSEYRAPEGLYGIKWNRLEGQSHSGDHAWCSGDGSSYIDGSNLPLYLPTINLSGMYRTYLSFWHISELEVHWDRVYLEYRTEDGTWTPLWNHTGLDFGWNREMIDISEAVLASGPEMELRFVLRTDESIAYKGWYFDDLMVFGEPEYTNISLGLDNTSFLLPPGGHADLVATLSNSGNIGADMDISIEGQLAQWARIEVDAVQLASGSAVDVPFNITAPSDAEAGLKGNLSFVARSAGQEWVAKVGVIITTTSGLNLSYKGDSGEEMPVTIGLFKNIMIGIENLGNGKEVVELTTVLDLNMTSGGEWKLLCPDNTTIDPFSSTDVQIQVQPPDNASFAEVARLTLYTSPSSNTSLNYTISMNLTVAWSRGIGMSMVDHVIAAPGTLVAVPANITNTGNGPDGYNLSVRSIFGWNVSVEPSQVLDVASGQTVSVDVLVSIPKGVHAGVKDMVQFKASPVNTLGWVTGRDLEVEVLKVRNISMTFDIPEVLDLSGKAGEEVSIGFTIHNNGNAAEKVHIEGPADWSTGPMIPGPYNIKPFDTRNGTMRIEIPDGAPFGPYLLTFTLRSGNEGEEGNVLGVYELYVSVEKGPGPSEPGPPLGLYAGATGAILILIVIAVLLVKRKGPKRPRKGKVEDDDEDEDSEE